MINMTEEHPERDPETYREGTPDDHIAELANQTTLTQRQVEVWVRRKRLGQDEAVIAHDLNIAPGTVRSHLARAKGKVDEARRLVTVIDRPAGWDDDNVPPGIVAIEEQDWDDEDLEALRERVAAALEDDDG